MNFVLDLFTKKEIMIIGVGVGSLILIILILTLLDFISKKKKEHDEFDEMFSEFENSNNELPKKEEHLEVVEKVETKKLDDDVEIIEAVEDVKEIKEDIKEEVMPIEPLIMDIEDDMENNSLNEAKLELLKIEEELKNPKSLEDTLYNLEAMEEENAIISYQELLENTKELNVVTTDSGDEPISLKEILNMYENEKEVEIDKEMSKTTIDDAYKGEFTSSPYLSPITGLEYEKNTSCNLADIQLENTANLEKLDKEMRKTNEFLSILNDLKKNLD